MSIRTATIVIIIVTFLVFAGALTFTTRVILLDSFRELEEKTAIENMGRITSAIGDVLTKMNSTSRDWASWDDTYNFVTGKKQTYINDNMDPAAIANLNVNVMVFVNAAGTPVFTKYINLAEATDCPIPAGYSDSVLALLSTSAVAIPDTGTTGLMMLPLGPMLFAARKILHSDGSGPPAGMLILGQYLDSVQVEKLCSITHLKFCVDDVTSSIKRHSEVSSLAPVISEQKQLVRPFNSKTIIGYTLLRDVHKAPGLIVRATMGRDIYRRGQSAMFYSIIWLIAIAFVFCLVVIMIVKNNILSPLTAIKQKLDELKKGADLTRRLPVEGSNEWAQLSQEINRYLSTLHETQEGLFKSERHYGILFKEMLNAFALHEIICDEHGHPCNYRFLEVNPAFEKVMGFPRKEIVGQTVLDVLPKVDPGLVKRYGYVALTGESERFEHFCTALNRYFEIAAFSPEKNKFAVTMTDITDRKNTELENQRMQQRLLQSQKMEAIGTLAGGVAHDFNNLLCAIQGYTELLLMDKSFPEKYLRPLNIMSDAALKGTELVKQILTFSRKVESKQRPVDLNNAIEQTTKILSRVIPRMISIETHLEKNVATIHADPVQIEQAIMNLSLNARDAMPEGGKLMFETKNVVLTDQFVKAHTGLKPGPHVLLSVSDTGHGIPKNVLPHIFDPFFTTKVVGKGTGLGLASVYGIVASHNGSISCYSEVDAGTTFRIYFPASDVALLPDTIPLHSGPAPVGTETILLIDDENVVRIFCQEVLTKHGYTVLTAASAEEGLELYSREKAGIQAIIIDLIMPGMGGKKGIELLVEINPEVKIIVATGYSPNMQKQEVLDKGAKAIIAKPYSISQLLTTLRSVLEGPKG